MTRPLIERQPPSLSLPRLPDRSNAAVAPKDEAADSLRRDRMQDSRSSAVQEPSYSLPAGLGNVADIAAGEEWQPLAQPRQHS